MAVLNKTFFGDDPNSSGSVGSKINTSTSKPNLPPLPTSNSEKTSTPSASTTPTSTTPASTNKTTTTTNRGSYVASDLVNQAQAALQAHLSNAPGAYQSQWQAQMDEIMNAYRNREDFQYDLDSDALYQQYADQYALKGQLAMMDTMGQAAAMTGGYGNSYAATAGNQAYQSYLQQLNEVIPELSAMAYDRYKQEGEDMLTEYSLLSDRESSDYAKYQDKLNKYYTDLDVLANRYDSERAFDYGSYQDQIAYDQWREEFDFQKGKYSDSLKAASDIYTDGDYTGNPVVVDDETDGNVTTNDVPASIQNKASTFTNNNDLASYLDGVAAAGSITEEQADALYAEYMTPAQASLQNRTWKMVDDGGVNWLWGIDNNAVVKDNYGNEYKLSKLKDALVSEGMSKQEAKDYVKNLQKKLGI